MTEEKPQRTQHHFLMGFVPVPRYENLYLVSMDGVFYGVKRRNYLRSDRHGGGYPKITFCKNGKRERRNIHRVLAEVFIKNPENKLQVNHVNGDKGDYRIDNLEWVTPSENMKHAIGVLGINPSQAGRFGKHHNKSKKVKQLSLGGELIKLWDSGMDAVRSCGYQSSSISRCCNGTASHHKGYKWEYV